MSEPSDERKAAWEQLIKQAEKLAADMRSGAAFVLPAWVKGQDLNAEVDRLEAAAKEPT